MLLLIFFPMLLLQHQVAANNNQGILNGIQDLKDDVASVLKKTNDIRSSLPKITLEISEALQMDPLVILQIEKLDVAKKKGDLVDECEEVLNSKYKVAVDKLHEYYSNRINEQLNAVQESLKSIEENTDEFIDKLKSDQLSEDEIEEIIEESDIDFYTVDRLKHILPYVVQNNLYDLDKAPAADIVKDTLLKPVYECLENAKITEYKEK